MSSFAIVMDLLGPDAAVQPFYFLLRWQYSLQSLNLFTSQYEQKSKQTHAKCNEGILKQKTLCTTCMKAVAVVATLLGCSVAKHEIAGPNPVHGSSRVSMEAR